MLIIKVHRNIAEQLKDFLIEEDLGFTRNGTEFEIPAAEPVGFHIGRAYEKILTQHNNALSKEIPKEEELAKDK